MLESLLSCTYLYYGIFYEGHNNVLLFLPNILHCELHVAGKNVLYYIGSSVSKTSLNESMISKARLLDVYVSDRNLI